MANKWYCAKIAPDGNKLTAAAEYWVYDREPDTDDYFLVNHLTVNSRYWHTFHLPTVDHIQFLAETTVDIIRLVIPNHKFAEVCNSATAIVALSSYLESGVILPHSMQVECFDGRVNIDTTQTYDPFTLHEYLYTKVVL